jgi:hypothetical protein
MSTSTTPKYAGTARDLLSPDLSRINDTMREIFEFMLQRAYPRLWVDDQAYRGTVFRPSAPLSQS